MKKVYKKIMKKITINYEKVITFLYQNNFFITFFSSKYCRRLVTNFYDDLPSPCLSILIPYHAYKVKKIRTVGSRWQSSYSLVIGDVLPSPNAVQFRVDPDGRNSNLSLTAALAQGPRSITQRENNLQIFTSIRHL